jgi:selenocysteine-specific elongation factor
VHVVATAGHVDHGKSTLVRALTGTDPDRLEEEHRRGLSIELGFCWTSLPGAGDIAFVDVPGHERFISTMLAGVGPVPAVMFVVAADDAWMPQAAEHLAALDAFGVRHGILVVTRSDLADPAPAMRNARDALATTGLAGIPALSVSGRTGAGLEELRAALVSLTSGLPAPAPDADVRLWVDRRFHVRGAGTVVTGTLDAGTIRVGDELALDDTPVRVRSLQSLGRPVAEVSGVARVALNLGGRLPGSLDRGSVLLTPGRWTTTGTVDVRLTSGRPPPERPMLHVGAASVGTRARSLGDDLSRLTLDRPLPLRIGDRALLRDPGGRSVWGVVVLAPDPAPLRRRGAAAERARQLDALDGTLRAEVAARGVVEVDRLRRLGVRVGRPDDDVLQVDGWLVSRRRAAELGVLVEEAVRSRASELQPGVPVGVVADQLGLAAAVVSAVAAAPVRQAAGRLFVGSENHLPDRVLDGWARVRADLERSPFDAPDAARLSGLGLDRSALAALDRAGLALRIDDQVVLLPGADLEAVEVLAGLAQPFSPSEARQALGTSRRVAVPLLEHLDRRRLTVRHPDSRRTVSQV